MAHSQKHLACERKSIAQACQLMANRYESRVDIRRLAEELGMTEFQLIRAFRRQRGTTPYEHLVRFRVDMARKLLAEGAAIADAALSCGFSDQSHLTRIFKRYVGLTPRAFQVANCKGPGRAGSYGIAA